jgi:leucyl aminopeptidase
MRVETAEAPPEGVQADVLVLALSDPAGLSEAGRALDDLLEGRLAKLLADGEWSGRRGRVSLTHSDGALEAPRILATGLGEAADPDAVTSAAARAARAATELGAKTVAWLLEDASDARAVVDGMALGPYDTGRWKTGDHRPGEIERLVLCGPGAPGAVEDARRTGVVAGWVNRCRDLVNAPPNELTPSALAAFAEELAGRFPSLSVEVFGPDEIEAAGMNAFMAVARGSDEPPRLVTLRHEPPRPTDEDFVLGLVGKGLTFDSGGFDLKPPGKMDDLKSDMGGAGAVLAGLGAIAELELPVRVLGVVASCENMISGRAYRPGDIVAASNGKTIEVTNTDAEGRLVLADALWHARSSGATHLLDLATLTGGVVIALGDFYAGLFANDADWLERVRLAGEASGDHAWPLPLHNSYKRYIESPFADMKNSSTLRQGTPLYAANFLAEFVGEGPWAHLDIAGTAYLERGRDDYYSSVGATGFGVRLVGELAQRLAA